MNTIESPTPATERRWLAQGLHLGMLRDETAVRIICLLDDND